MKLNEHERPRPNMAGLSSLGQQAEMKLLLAGRWPALKPLPVFKFETADFRVSIDFDKTRGEWLCRKTSLPSYKVEELRGGLPEMILALPHAQAEVFAGCAAAGQQEEELDKEASRRRQAILEWKANFENGALYSGLQEYLSESQRGEIDYILRLTLTARQLQFSPKNVAYVFDALSKAGGKLATLLEIARRNKLGQAADVPPEVEAAAPDVQRSLPVESLMPATLERFPEEPVASVCPEQAQPSAAERIAHTSPAASKIVTPDILDGEPPSFAEDLQEKVHQHVPFAGFERHVRTRRVEPSANRIENLSSRQHVLEISGYHVAAFAVVFLFAVISLPIGLTVGRGPLGQWLRDTQQSLFAAHVAQPALTEHPVEATSKYSAPLSPNPIVDSDHSSGITPPGSGTLPEEKPGENAGDAESSIDAPPTISNLPPAPDSRLSAHAGAIPGRDGSRGLIARVAPPPATPEPAHSFKPTEPVNGAWKNHASRSFAPSMGALPHRSTPSGILVTTPARGSKPFRVSFPGKPIAASSSFAMTSELSVLVPPEPGSSAAHASSRLRAGELAYFVWPRYSRQGERYGSAETVRVRATVGQLGQVLEIKFLSGSAALFPAARNAVHLWRYRPTLLNNRPIAVQQDITIEFRPPQYLSQVRTQHPS